MPREFSYLQDVLSEAVYDALWDFLTRQGFFSLTHSERLTLVCLMLLSIVSPFTSDEGVLLFLFTDASDVKKPVSFVAPNFTYHAS